MPEKVNASAGTCIVALWRSLDLFMELSWQDCDRRERFDRLGLSEQLISCGIPLCCCQFSPSVFFRRLVFCDMEEDCKFRVVCRMLTKEGIAQSVAVLGAPSSIICQNPNVLVWSRELGDNNAFIPCNETQSSFSSCCPNNMIQGLKQN